MKILSVGGFDAYGISNTCLHRHWALEKCADYIDNVNTVLKAIGFRYKLAYHLFQKHIPVRLPDCVGANDMILAKLQQHDFDVIWIDKGITILAKTLAKAKQLQPYIKIVSYSPDNMALRHNQSQQYLECVPFYDCIVTNKSYIVNELKALGAKKVVFVNNTFEPTFHYPHELSDDDIMRLGGDVGFIGAWEEERCQSILYLADYGINVRVWGGGKWLEYKDYSPNLKIEDKGLYSEDYCKALKAFKINLCFLRKINFDQQTTRSVEIPACGGFMLAERTTEHLNMFKEDKEAVYFSSPEELLSKCKYYLTHDEERTIIAKEGLKRCIDSDYSNLEMVKSILTRVYGHC